MGSNARSSLVVYNQLKSRISTQASNTSFFLLLSSIFLHKGGSCTRPNLLGAYIMHLMHPNTSHPRGNNSSLRYTRRTTGAYSYLFYGGTVFILVPDSLSCTMCAVVQQFFRRVLLVVFRTSSNALYVQQTWSSGRQFPVTCHEYKSSRRSLPRIVRWPELCPYFMTSWPKN